MDVPGADFELWVAFNEARAERDADARIVLMGEVVRLADEADAPCLTYLSRRVLADTYQLRSRWDETYRLFRECLDEFDTRPHRFDEEDVESLLTWYAYLVECMVDFPHFGLREIRAALDDVERRVRAAGLTLHQVHSARRGLAAHLGDWTEAERAYVRWTATADIEGDDRWLTLVGIDQLLARGDEESVAHAHLLAEPMLADPAVTEPPVVQTRFEMLLPLARAGKWEEAVLTFRRLRRGMAGGAHRMEHLGQVIEFCALTGNLDAGVDRLGPMAGFESRGRPFATMEFATAASILADAQVRAGKGETRLNLGDDPNSLPFRQVADRMRAKALDLADAFDARNGTTTQGDRVRARLDARPLTGFLPLLPTSRPPLRPETAGLSDEALLELARWHELRCEQDEARACMAAVSADLPEHLAAQLAELRAKFFQGPETEQAFRDAAEVLLAHGDRRLALLNHCWLGLWVVFDGRVEEGIAITAAAVDRLRELGDESASAWGEHWLAHVLAGQGRREEARAALERGKRHAEVAGDLLALGTLLELEGSVFPETALETASAALAAFIAVEAPEKALESLARLTAAHHERGDAEAVHHLVERLLARPAPETLARFTGRLRYLRACRSIDAGQVADAADDLNEAIGQADLREGAPVDLWYRLVHADHAAGRYEDAVDAGLLAAGRLDHLRDTESQDWADWADIARYLVAESYRHLGDLRAALREYQRLANGQGTMASTAFVTATSLMEQLEDRV